MTDIPTAAAQPCGVVAVGASVTEATAVAVYLYCSLGGETGVELVNRCLDRRLTFPETRASVMCTCHLAMTRRLTCCRVRFLLFFTDY